MTDRQTDFFELVIRHVKQNVKIDVICPERFEMLVQTEILKPLPKPLHAKLPKVHFSAGDIAISITTAKAQAY